MNTIREVQKINDRELELGIAGTSASWHAQYSKSAWIYIGNVDTELSEGDLLCVLSQYGEIEDLHLARHEETTGKSKGFAFCKYEDARSCILAVDNLCGIQLCGRSLRIDHVENYRLPKHLAEKEEEAAATAATNVDVSQPGAAYAGKELANEFTLDKGHDLFAPPAVAAPAAPSSEAAPANTITTITTNKNDNAAADNSKEAKLRRKAERQWKREEKEKRNRAKEQRRVEREERRREKRARKMRKGGDGGASSTGSRGSPENDYDHTTTGSKHKERDDQSRPEKKKKKKKKHHHRRHHQGTSSTSDTSI